MDENVVILVVAIPPINLEEADAASRRYLANDKRASQLWAHSAPPLPKPWSEHLIFGGESKIESKIALLIASEVLVRALTIR